jgi:hypothetical protein
MKPNNFHILCIEILLTKMRDNLFHSLVQKNITI